MTNKKWVKTNKKQQQKNPFVSKDITEMKAHNPMEGKSWQIVYEEGILLFLLLHFLFLLFLLLLLLPFSSPMYTYTQSIFLYIYNFVTKQLKQKQGS